MRSVSFDTKVWFPSGIERGGRCKIIFPYKDMYLYIKFSGRINEELLILVTEERRSKNKGIFHSALLDFLNTTYISF